MFKKYYNLTKPKVVALIMFTAIVGMLLAGIENVPLSQVFAAIAGIGLAAASGAAINHWVDQKIDVIMERTKNRPLPHGDLSSVQALTFALSLAVISMVLLVVWVNNLTAILTFISLMGYAVIYTVFLKRSTPQNIVYGGAAGAAPPLLGWVAMTGTVNTEALLLFLIIFIWTPPHFWALAIRRKDEYAKADIPMLPVTHGVKYTKRLILLYSLMLFSVSLMPFVIQMSGIIYLIAAVILGAIFVIFAWKLYIDDENKLAMKTFSYSIFYLSALFLFLLADHYARIFIHSYF
ncbi:MAG: protoheme IX farnesyltransferase [Gammaproteobacteria bacterium]|nr:MAG: protoheme IX farnesyltransferase [Gammaproteobacteria bacterium]